MRIRYCLSSLRARLLSIHGVKTEPAGGMTASIHRSINYPDDELFRYTSGRWIYNERLRLSERYLRFDVSALKNVIASSFGRAPSDIITFSKLSEGGFNRVFQTRFKDGRCVIARLPYPSTTPEHYTVASEVATLDYLRLHGIRTPEVYAWCSTKENPVGSEYIIMEKLSGIPLGDIWYSMTPKQQLNMMKKLVDWEGQLMSLKFPAYGSIYYSKDLTVEEKIYLPGQRDVEFCIGPISHYSWWHDGRNTLNIDRGPWLSPTDIFRAAGERELSWTKAYAKSRLPYERLYREIHGFCKVSPDAHIGNLSDYLKLVPFLEFSSRTALHRPVIRHPDFQPNNILVSESEELKEPQLDLPPDFDSLSPSEQASARETLHKRLVHFLYAAFTRRLNEEHYDAIFDNSVILHQRLFKSAGTPWEGDSATLQADMIRAIQSWRDLIATDSMLCTQGTLPSPPIHYSDQAIQDTIDLDSRQREADIAMEQMRHAFGVDVLGWVPNSEYEAAKQLAEEMKARMLEAAKTPHDVTGVRDHFPFDDFDEDV